MVLTEAFAAGTPVVASDIAGYSDVVTRRRRRRPRPARRPDGAGRDAARPRAGPRAPRAPGPPRRALRAALRLAARRGGRPRRLRGRDRHARAARARRRAHGLKSADGRPYVRPRRLPSLDPPPPAGSPHPALAIARKVALGAVALGILFLAFVALERIGVDNIVRSLVASQPAWVLAGLGVMCASMVLRGDRVARDPQAALPGVRVRLSDALQGTFIGVLMSATLPARLGEPSRALIVSRRLGRAREYLPTVAGSIVSQALLNVFALVVLGVVDVLDRRRLHAAQAAARWPPSRRSRCSRSWCSRRSCCGAGTQQRAPGRVRRGGAPRARAGPPRPAGVPRPAPGLARRGRAAVGVGPAVAVLLHPARRSRARRHGRPRRRRRGALRGQRHRRRSRPRRRTSASSRPRASRCSAPTASARPTRSPTGSSCRRSRSRPP